MKHMTYLFQGIPRALWQRVKVRAAQRGETVKAALLRFLARYAAGKDLHRERGAVTRHIYWRLVRDCVRPKRCEPMTPDALLETLATHEVRLRANVGPVNCRDCSTANEWDYTVTNPEKFCENCRHDSFASDALAEAQRRLRNVLSFEAYMREESKRCGHDKRAVYGPDDVLALLSSEGEAGPR